jgi:hypothetical protein
LRCKLECWLPAGTTYCPGPKVETGNTNKMGRLSTLDLHIKVAFMHLQYKNELIQTS